MATVSEGTLIDFGDSNSLKDTVVTDGHEQANASGETVAVLEPDVVAPATTIDISPVALKHRNISQAEYDSGVEDDSHGKKTMSPDTPSPGAHSPPLKQETKQTEAPHPPEAHQSPPTEDVRPKTVAGTALKAPAVKTQTKSKPAPSTTVTATRPKTTPSKGPLTSTTVRTSTISTTKKVATSKENISAPKPAINLRNVHSKIGSLDHAAHKPGGGNVKIENRKLDFSHAKPKVAAAENLAHTPGGGDKKVESHQLVWKAESKIGSLQNASHQPVGGNVKVVTQKLEWKAQSKIGSLENATHKPTGGNVKIASVKVDFTKAAKSKIGSLDKANHKPGGGNVQIKTEKIDFTKAKPKIGSLDNADHKPGGGDVKIKNEKLKIDAHSKIGSLPTAAPISARTSTSKDEQ